MPIAVDVDDVKRSHAFGLWVLFENVLFCGGCLEWVHEGLDLGQVGFLRAPFGRAEHAGFSHSDWDEPGFLLVVLSNDWPDMP